MLKRAVFTAMAAAALASACAGSARRKLTPQDGARRLNFQILEDWDNGTDLDDVARDFDLFRDLGITTWRGSFSWLQLEPERGRYDFAWLHRFADLAASRGIELRPYVAYTPAWAAAAPSNAEPWNVPPRNMDDWGAFVRALAAAMRDHPNIISYEIYNEEDAPQWWAGTAAQYAETLARAADAIRRTDPRISLLPGGLVYADAAWIARVCGDAGARRAVAVVPFHAYPETWTPSETTVENYLGDRFENGFVRTVDERCGRKPIWVNEAGYATVDGRTERQQADWWERAIATFAAEPRIEEIGVYEIKDLRPDRPAIGGEANYHLGITRSDRTPKMAFATIRRLVALMASHLLRVRDDDLDVTPHGQPRSDVFAHLFVRDDDAQILFLWSKRSATVDVRLPRAGTSIVEYRVDGTPEPARTLEGAAIRDIALAPGAVRLFVVGP